MLFGGETKIGKSLIMGELIRNLVLGESPLDIPTFSVAEKTKILMVEQELGPWGLQKRIKTAYKGVEEALGDSIHFISQDPEFIIGENPKIKEHLIKYIKELGIGVLFLDPMNRLHCLNENDNQDVGFIYRTLEGVIDACRDLGTSIVFSHHFRKKPMGRDTQGYDALDPNNFSGSYKWISQPGTLATIQRHHDREPLLNDAGGRMWELSVGWTLRNGEPIDDLSLTVNRDNDLRVNFRSWGRVKPAKKKKAAENEEEDEAAPVKKPMEKLVFTPKTSSIV